MPKRLPEPANGVRPRLILSEAEFEKAEDLAHEMRLSVASFLRAYVAAMMEGWGSAQRKAVEKTVERMKELPPGKRKPGTQPKE